MHTLEPPQWYVAPSTCWASYMWRSELHDTACCKYAQIPPCRSLNATALPQRCWARYMPWESTYLSEHAFAYLRIYVYIHTYIYIIYYTYVVPSWSYISFHSGHACPLLQARAWRRGIDPHGHFYVDKLPLDKIEWCAFASFVFYGMQLWTCQSVNSGFCDTFAEVRIWQQP